jgi:hypothetical protein
MLAYFDCFAGASGDMILGALVDAGWPVQELATVAADLGLAAAVTVSAERVQRAALAATRVHVRPTEPAPPPRRLADIRALLDHSRLPAAVVADAGTVFDRLAQAEAAVHGIEPAEVHFHEVGALDAVIDVAGAVAGLHALEVSAIGCSPLPLASGWVTSRHGPLPLPAPATLALMAAAAAPAGPVDGTPLAGGGELTTPTAAAILTTLARFERPAMSLCRVGHGAGARQTPWPNVLRLWLGQPVAPAEDRDLVLLETNIDDMAAELFGHVMDRLLAAGALDVFFTPIQMKKSRPATMLSVLAPGELEGALATLLLAETSSFGVRVQPVRRHVATRETRQVATPFGTLPVKLKLDGRRILGYAPEYEASRVAAAAHGVPLARVYAAVLAAAAAAEEAEWT